MTKFITVVSGKGGVGKTTTAINLGCALNYFGQDVTVVDANLSMPNIGLYLGVPVVPINLHHVLKDKNHITESIYMHPAGTKIVPGSISLDDLRDIHPAKLNKVIRSLDGTSDFVIIDSAAGLGDEAISAIYSGDEILIVTNPELPAITDALKTIKFCEAINKKIMGVVLAKTKPKNFDVTVSNINSILETPIIGVVPDDSAMRRSLVMRDAAIYTHPRSIASVSYKKIAADMIGRPYEPELSPEKSSFILKIFKLLGLK
jgi:septum site-determining protein MinD